MSEDIDETENNILLTFCVFGNVLLNAGVMAIINNSGHLTYLYIFPFILFFIGVINSILFVLFDRLKKSRTFYRFSLSIFYLSIIIFFFTAFG